MCNCGDYSVITRVRSRAKRMMHLYIKIDFILYYFVLKEDDRKF